MNDLEIRKKIVEILNGCFETDWVYNGEDEMPVKSFNKDEAADELVIFIHEICPPQRELNKG